MDFGIIYFSSLCVMRTSETFIIIVTLHKWYLLAFLIFSTEASKTLEIEYNPSSSLKN